MAKRRRSYRRRLRARRFIGGRRKHGLLSRLITPAAFLGTFLQQITQKDLATNFTQTQWQNTPPIRTIEIILATAFQRLTGFNALPNYIPSSPFQINPAGILNKWTGLGIAGILYGKFGDGLPYRSQARKLGSGAFAGGIVGGLFDNPTTERFAGYTGSQVPKGAQQGISGTGIANE